MLWLTYAAIGGLVWFWLATAKAVQVEHLMTQPLLPKGWSGVLGAIPYALWWLVIIETIALAAEEAHEPHVTIPRGMVLAQVTLVVLVVLTWFFACGAANYTELKTGEVDYPLPLVFKAVWGNGWFMHAFNIVALSGIVVSYNGMLFATSRQSFSLGRAGYLPSFLGKVHRERRVPHVSLIVWTATTIAFIIFGHFFKDATAVGVLISTLAALIWYILAMVCLFRLRKKEPDLFRPYRVPVYPLLPFFVAALAGLAAYTYAQTNVNVLIPTAIAYAVAMGWYFLIGHKQVLPVAPEEVTARIAEQLTKTDVVVIETPAKPTTPVGQAEHHWSITSLHRVTAVMLVLGLLSLGRMILESGGWLPQHLSLGNSVIADIGIWSGLFGLVCAVGLMSTRNKR
jgi:ethanolamine permease